MSTAETGFYSEIPDNPSKSNALPANDSIYETPCVQQKKLKDTKDTTVKGGLIALAIFLAMVIGLVVFGLVIIIQLQGEMRIMKEQLEHQETQSFARLKSLEENASQIIYSSLDEQQIQINQSVEDISSLNIFYENLVMRVIQDSEEVTFKLTGVQISLIQSIDDISSVNRSQQQLMELVLQDSEAFNSKFNEQQIQLNQCIDDVNNLNSSHQQFMKSVIQGSPKNCKTVNREYAKISNTTGGVIDIYPELGDNPVEVYCDLVTDGGGWIVFQRRMDGTEDFYRGWNDYVNGFGERDKEMWLGLETIHQLTKDESFELRINLEDFNGTTSYANYGNFSIASASENYTLLVGEYNGTSGDSLAPHNSMRFSTKDSDNEGWLSRSCAEELRGGWWYNDCHYSNLNGVYYQDGRNDTKSVNWFGFRKYQALKFTEMMFRKNE